MKDGPWLIDATDTPGESIYITDRTGYALAKVDTLEHAHFILTAVNNHDSLVEALRDAVSRLGDEDICQLERQFGDRERHDQLIGKCWDAIHNAERSTT